MAAVAGGLLLARAGSSALEWVCVSTEAPKRAEGGIDGTQPPPQSMVRAHELVVGSAPVCGADGRGGLVVVVTEDGGVCGVTAAVGPASWGAASVEPLVDCHNGAVTGVAAHPDGAHVLSCGVDGSVRVWEAVRGQLRGRRDVLGRLTSIAAAPGRALAAVGSVGGVVR